MRKEQAEYEERQERTKLQYNAGKVAGATIARSLVEDMDAEAEQYMEGHEEDDPEDDGIPTFALGGRR